MCPTCGRWGRTSSAPAGDTCSTPTPARWTRWQFERLTDEAVGSLSANPERAAESLRAGLGLWRGRPYADLIGVEGLQAEIRRLEELRFSAVEARIDADLALGRHQVVAGELVAWRRSIRCGSGSRRS